MKINLSQEQDEIRKNNSNFLIVSAGPGSGKTETLSWYIIDRAKELVLNKKILVCSYTVKGTNEIKTRTLRNNKDHIDLLSESIIFSTFDSFLMNYFWKYYLNRIILFISKLYEIEINKKSYSFDKIIYNTTDHKDFYKNKGDTDWIKEKVISFINSFENNSFLSGPISDFILSKYIENEDNIGIKKYISIFFDRIIIDEAQDLSVSRYNILMFLNYYLNIKLTFIGDERQTIYTYLGASSKIFNKIINKLGNDKVKKMSLLKNHRYKGENEGVKKLLLSNQVNFYQNLSDTFKTFRKTDNINFYIKNVDKENTVFILTNTNVEIENILNLIDDKDVGATLRIPKEITDNITAVQKDFIENLYAYKLIKGGDKSIMKRIDRERRPTQVIFDFLWPGDESANDKFLNLFSNNNQDFKGVISYIEHQYKFDIWPLWNKISENQNYLSILSPKRIQIMTVHGSKGLEADFVLFSEILITNYLNNTFNRMEFENIFVALSRTKKEIILY